MRKTSWGFLLVSDTGDKSESFLQNFCSIDFTVGGNSNNSRDPKMYYRIQKKWSGTSEI